MGAVAGVVDHGRYYINEGARIGYPPGKKGLVWSKNGAGWGAFIGGMIGGQKGAAIGGWIGRAIGGAIGGIRGRGDDW